MSTKKIIVSQALLNPKTKTKKNIPVSNPTNSDLKRRLLKRIKEHKQGISSNSDQVEEEKKKDDFNSSLEYLSLLKQKNEFANKTRKNHNEEKLPTVFLDLPEELLNPSQFTSVTPSSVPSSMPLSINDCIPYSNLKNGTKPMYRDWSKTVRNYSNVGVPPSINNTMTSPLSAQIIPSTPSVHSHIVEPSPQLPQTVPLAPLSITKKRTTIKTIKRKYNLGKSLKNRSVGVLLKDKKSNATVMEAQKQLKTKTIADVKQYLREHNLITAGTNAPTDVLRKLYESAMMAGEITNSNKETLLENVSSDF
jgi:hypothetical protein